MSHKLADVDVYLEDLEPSRRHALGILRSLIVDTLPDVVETLRYRMPTYELGEVVCAMASQKHYMSLYMDTELVEEHKDALKHLNCGKSCIRFKKLDELPLATIAQILEQTVEKQRATRQRASRAAK